MAVIETRIPEDVDYDLIPISQTKRAKNWRKCARQPSRRLPASAGQPQRHRHSLGLVGKQKKNERIETDGETKTAIWWIQISHRRKWKIQSDCHHRKQEVYTVFYDSLQLASGEFQRNRKLMDVGAALVFRHSTKIIFPNFWLFIIEPTLKNAVLAALTKCWAWRMEIIKARGGRCRFHLRPSRGHCPSCGKTACFRTCSSLCGSWRILSCHEGSFLQWRSAWSRKCFKVLSSEVRKHIITDFKTFGERVILKIRKNETTKEIYPAFAAIKRDIYSNNICWKRQNGKIIW